MDEGSPRSILIIDDHAVVRQGLVSAISTLEHIAVAEADSYKSAIELAKDRDFTLAIIDFQLNGANGIDCALALSLLQPEMGFILLTVEDSLQIIKSAESAGFRAFISKNTPLTSIVATVASALSQEISFQCITGSVTANDERYSFLTKAEVEIVSYLRSGLTTREIAANRFCSEATVKSHLGAIYRKLGVRNRTGAIAALEGIKRR